VWALEDCRHVSGSFERLLVARGERVVRVATRLMAGERRAGRDRGKSDRIDAIAVARAALREGLERLPVAQPAGIELEIRLLVDHRERLVGMRTAIYNDLLWHLHDLWPEQTFPGCALLSKKWSTRIARRLARAEQTARVRIARDELGHLRELSQTINLLETEIAETAAATARSTPPSTASPSPAPAATPKPRPTSNANAPKARPTAKRCAAQTPPRSPHLAPASAAPPDPLNINLLTKEQRKEQCFAPRWLTDAGASSRMRDDSGCAISAFHR
jgi:transposase